MTTTLASAPGKLVLIGEYVVLDGGPALSAAVASRATARIAASSARYSQLSIANTDERFSFSYGGNGQINWHEAPGQSGLLLDAAIKQLGENSGIGVSEQPIEVLLDTRDFYIADGAGQSIKIGAGSSAALCVALTAALQKHFGSKPDFGLCAKAHQSFQRGKGSGIDVVTSWHGGVVSMRNGGKLAADVRQHEWPEGLYVLPVWTGLAASTPAMLTQLEAYQGASPDGWQALRGQLAGVAEAALTCWESADASGFIEQASEYARYLKDLDEAAKLGIWSKPHLELQNIAGGCNAVYKPSGAGGGDFGLVFAPEIGLLEQLSQEFVASGFAGPVPAWTSRGLELSSQQ